MATPTPLPPAQEDPAIIRGQQLQREYEDQVAAVRAQVSEVTELARARRIDTIWRSTCSTLGGLWSDLQGRRSARMEYLQTQVPSGPEVPQDVSAADRAVLMAAFRAALDKARAADDRELRSILSDAQRFGDDTMKRAVYTVVTQEGRGLLWDDAMAMTPGLQDVLSEIEQLRKDLTGQGPGNSWAYLALNQPRQPDESKRLPLLERLDAEASTSRISRSTTPYFRP